MLAGSAPCSAGCEGSCCQQRGSVPAAPHCSRNLRARCPSWPWAPTPGQGTVTSVPWETRRERSGCTAALGRVRHVPGRSSSERAAQPPGEPEPGPPASPAPPERARSSNDKQAPCITISAGESEEEKGSTKQERNRREVGRDRELSPAEIPLVSGSSSFPGTAAPRPRLFPLRDFTAPAEALLLSPLS